MLGCVAQWCAAINNDDEWFEFEIVWGLIIRHFFRISFVQNLYNIMAKSSSSQPRKDNIIIMRNHGRRRDANSDMRKHLKEKRTPHIYILFVKLSL